MATITPFLWFESQAEEAAELYVSIFENSKIQSVSRYPEGSPLPMGTAMEVSFTLDGVDFQAINGGAAFTFNEAISFAVTANTQQKIDRLWDALTTGGGSPSQCGWVKDRFGVSWQIVPTVLGELLGGSDPEVASRVMRAMLTMTKLDIAELISAGASEIAV
ncbi:MAG: VOC family protein [Microbacteriaceae bacterium]|nr:VOC family protein [Microbacteriaceae bacterium]